MKSILRYSTSLGLILAIYILDGCAPTTLQLNRDAQLCYRQSDYPQAVDLLNQSLDINYEKAPPHYWLGKCYEAQGSLTKAIWEYELAVRFDPSLEKAQIAWIKSLQKDKQNEKSLEVTRNFLKYKIAPAKKFVQLGTHLLNEGMNEQGFMAFDRAREVEPKNGLPLVALADYYFAQNDKESGVKYLTEAFQVDPLYPGLGRRLGEMGYRVEIQKPTAPKPIADEEKIF